MSRQNSPRQANSMRGRHNFPIPSSLRSLNWTKIHFSLYTIIKVIVFLLYRNGVWNARQRCGHWLLASSRSGGRREARCSIWQERCTVKYAFVIDQRKCIGCHACTVACKSEHDVPIGVYRTWVKYIEKGQFPDSRRYFLVNRCNHCDNAPCVAICPTKALYKREDGIVDFDSSRCIGCKSCMQACPYDALYIDPNTHTAAKCNYCAHRTELGLEPACVVVCPEHAIIAGDLHNPNSEIARIIAREPVRVRKPEQGTGPNVYYLGADEAAINPEAALEELPSMTMWSTMLKPHYDDERMLDGGHSLRAPQTLHPLGTAHPHVDGQSQSGEAHVVYDTPKTSAPWGWKVSAYLGTKSIGAGVMVVAALAIA